MKNECGEMRQMCLYMYELCGLCYARCSVSIQSEEQKITEMFLLVNGKTENLFYIVSCEHGLVEQLFIFILYFMSCDLLHSVDKCIDSINYIISKNKRLRNMPLVSLFERHFEFHSMQFVKFNPNLQEISPWTAAEETLSVSVVSCDDYYELFLQLTWFICFSLQVNNTFPKNSTAIFLNYIKKIWDALFVCWIEFCVVVRTISVD